MKLKAKFKVERKCLEASSGLTCRRRAERLFSLSKSGPR